jgi:hypothetical protein
MEYEHKYLQEKSDAIIMMKTMFGCDDTFYIFVAVRS